MINPVMAKIYITNTYGKLGTYIKKHPRISSDIENMEARRIFNKTKVHLESNNHGYIVNLFRELKIFIDKYGTNKSIIFKYGNLNHLKECMHKDINYVFDREDVVSKKDRAKIIQIINKGINKKYNKKSILDKFLELKQKFIRGKDE